MAKTKRQTEHASRHVQRHSPRVPTRAQRPSRIPGPPRPQPEPRIVYSDDLAAKLCEHVADGLSLKEVCLLDGMPARRTVYKWLGEHANFVLMYARAREERADLIADEIVMIADTDPDPQRARNRIDARKWMAARLNPKAYGDKLVTENTNTNYMISDKPLTEEEFEEKYCSSGGAPASGIH